MLNEYLKTLQGFMRERSQRNLSPDDLVSYINRSRREIALRTQCIRILTPIAGQIESIEVANPGANYTAPVVTITPPDAPNGTQPFPGGAQATAIAQQVGGVLSDITLTFGGDGYFQPQVTISDPTGSGATATANITPISQTQGFQEVYPFNAVSLAMFPGLGKIFAVNSVSIIYSNYRYSLPIYSFSEYQARIRQYPLQYLYVPTLGAQYGQGTNGSFYLYPIASTRYAMEWDCFCLPANLDDDDQAEALAEPWTDVVPYFAAHLCYLEMQNLNAAKFYLELHDQMIHRYSAYARPGRSTNPYGRY